MNASPTSTACAPAAVMRRTSAAERSPLSATTNAPDGARGARRSAVARETSKVARSRLLMPMSVAPSPAARYPTDYLLLDSFVAGQAGGTGVALDPARAAGLPAARLFVAGGLRPDTVAEVVRALRPFAVDVASGVEASPGRKDHAKVEEFIRRAKAA